MLHLLFADLTKLERLLELPEGFIEALFNEDDWSFVIKSHAVLEAFITHVLIHSNDPRLADIFRKLQVGGGKTGKIAFVQSLDLLDERSIRFINRISELRNTLIHDVRQFSFQLPNYVHNLTKSELNNFSRIITAVFEPDAKIDEPDWVLEMPKEAIGLAVLVVLTRALFRIDPVEHERAKVQAEKSAPLIAIAFIVAALMKGSKSRKTDQPEPVSP